ncbi:MAG: hypothetical protein JWM25_445 [Thermoleophilia bacterium]|nr:hypothetical protein [Thermoleophilia bacterium]MCZ4495862.1 hypothetical protein [Thermoleophilia bacterium]
MQVSVDTTIEQPRKDVFSAFCDLEQACRCMHGLERVDLITPGPFDLGTRWRETRRVLGRTVAEELWVTRLVHGRTFRVEGESGGTHYISDLEFEDVPDAAAPTTHVTMTLRGIPLTRTARCMAWTDRIATATTRRMLKRDLDDMRIALEQVRARR